VQIRKSGLKALVGSESESEEEYVEVAVEEVEELKKPNAG